MQLREFNLTAAAWHVVQAVEEGNQHADTIDMWMDLTGQSTRATAVALAFDVTRQTRPLLAVEKPF